VTVKDWLKVIALMVAIYVVAEILHNGGFLANTH